MQRFLQYAYYVRWYISSLFAQQRPILATVVLHNGCNLSCRHCSLASSPPLQLSAEAVLAWLRSIYGRGARMLFFEGGEPLLWRDGGYDLQALISEARKIGFHSVGYTSNGTLPLCGDADIISVSIDGPPSVHDRIRGEGVWSAVRCQLDALDPSVPVFANTSISGDNVDSIQACVEAAAQLSNVRGILFNFVTPPTSVRVLEDGERKKVLSEIKALRKRGPLPIFNTSAGLRFLGQPNWKENCPAWMSAFLLPDGQAMGREVFGCPLRNHEGDESPCVRCGFAAPREWKAMLSLRMLSAISLSRRFHL